MASITPTITVSSTPGISVSTSATGVSYQALMNSLGNVVYDIQEMYYYSQQASQLNAPLGYNVYNAGGDFAGQTILTPISPLQYQNTLFIDLKKNGIKVNGQSGLSFNMLPLNMVQFIFWGSRIQNMDGLDSSGHINNFKETEREMGIPGFFDLDQIEKGSDEPVIEFVEEEE